ncbi:anaphase-promoting complex protein [Paramyrothecium foliicola]|nr:anaphase-promoting complex protein [Paramyrothecium foliicola]
MARYLTPAKIGLLALIELYSENAVPSDAVLSVLSFVTSHLLDHVSASHPEVPASQWSKAERTVSLVISIRDFEKLLAGYPFLMGMPGRKLWDHFIGKLWDINSLDALHVFFENLASLVALSKDERKRQEAQGIEEPPGLMKFTPTSPFGAFVRRSRVEFQRLRFHDCTELWKDFVRYRQPTAPYQKRRKGGDTTFGRLSFDNVLFTGEQVEWDVKSVSALAAVTYGDMLTGDETSSLPVSTDDVEALLDFQIDRMQKFGNRVPVEIRNQFHDVLHDSFLVPSLTHYLRLVLKCNTLANIGPNNSVFSIHGALNRDRLFYQYALMNLAVLQADFGCYKDAVAAMLETVSTARENRDMTCLNFALNWLFHFGRSHPKLVQELESNSMLGTGKESLAFLRVKAKETGMWTLWSSVLLSEAKAGLVKGDSMAASLAQLVRSSQVILEKNMRNMFGSQLALSSALWDRLGLSHVSTITSVVFQRCHARHSIFDDELKFTCRLALAQAERGRYEEAFQTLEILDENSLRSWKPRQYWHKYRSIIRLRKDLHHNNIDGAEQLLSQLLQSKMDDLEPELAFQVDLLHIDCMSRRGDLQEAYTKTEALLNQACEENKDVAVTVKLLLVKISILNQCGRPQRGFSIAMRAASLCWRARLVSLLWQAIGSLANILVSLGEFEAAAGMLIASLPRAMECENAALTGQLYSHLADANMGLAGIAVSQSSRRMEYLTSALAAVEKAFSSFSAVEDMERQCELMAKKATIMKLSGESTLAADYAAAYVALRRNAETLSMGAD